MRKTIANSAVVEKLNALSGLECWYVNAGGSAGSTFSLSLGERVLRDRATRNTDASSEFQKYQGEATLLVWCSWRLDGEQTTIGSSDEEPSTIKHKLQPLVGKKIQSVEALNAAHDIEVDFGDVILRIFCDYVPADSSSRENWQLEHQGQLTAVGPGYEVHCETIAVRPIV